MDRYGGAPNQPLEFKIIQLKSVGLTRNAWCRGDTKLGSGEELELILNFFGNEGWDVVQMMPATNSTPPHILLRRLAR